MTFDEWWKTQHQPFYDLRSAPVFHARAAWDAALEEGLNLLLTEYGEFRKGGCSPNESLDRAEVVVRNHIHALKQKEE